MDFTGAKLDIVFKMIMTQNKEILKYFVSAMLEMPAEDIKDITILNPKLLPADVDGKKPELDLKLQVCDKIVDVEVQLCNKKAYPERSLYYWAKLYSEQLDQGENYDLLPRTICINILDFVLFHNCPSPYSEFQLLEKDRHTRLTDRLSIMFCELNKIDDVIDPDDRKKLWLQFIKADSEEELNMLNNTGVREIKDAIVTLHEMTSDELNRSMIAQRKKDIADRIAEIEFAKDEGIEQGKARERAATAARMRADGVPEEFIRKYYGGESDANEDI